MTETPNPNIDPDSFRYPGPKPQSRETAIAMLADSTEAAVRSSPDHSAEGIDAIVEEIFAERLTEGQVDESDITLKNLRALAQSFKHEVADQIDASAYDRVMFIDCDSVALRNIDHLFEGDWDLAVYGEPETSIRDYARAFLNKHEQQHLEGLGYNSATWA